MLRELSALSARLGKDPGLVQGAGGNTSLKDRQTLWVKASGKWLAAAAEEDLFVGLDLRHVRERIAAGQGDDLSSAVSESPNGLRPSIETTLHALLPHAVVLHVHSVRAIALAVRRDAGALLRERLDGLRWAFVPYRRPGLPLTQAVKDVLERDPADILVLANHGLVVGGADCAAAAALLADVEKRLTGFQRAAFHPDLRFLDELAAGSAYRRPRADEAHGLAADGAAGLAAGGSLYPDHVVFLGPAVARLKVGAALPRPAANGLPVPAVVVIPGKGVLVRDGLSAGAEEMVRALGLVVERIPDDASLNYLAQADEDELLGWDAEKYRQSLAV